jgi:putative hydrolase of the HAD superfamily
MLPRPRGLLFDYGGTLVEEVSFDARTGNAALLSHATPPPRASLEEVVERADRISREVSGRRDVSLIETPWVALTRLIHDFFGTRFTLPPNELEIVFWDASVKTRPMPGVRDALMEFRRAGIPMGVVSNSSFAGHVLRHDLAKHDLASFLDVVVASAEYVIRKPDPLLFETAAALLGVPHSDIWFVGDRVDTDVIGARAAGMTTVLLARDARESPPGVDVLAADWAAVAVAVREAIGPRAG